MTYKPHTMTGQKIVRIDNRTVICVSVNISDDIARENYLKKHETFSMITESPRWKNSKKKLEEKIVESDESTDISIDDEEIEVIIENNPDPTN